MATQDYTADGDEITPAPRTLTTVPVPLTGVGRSTSFVRTRLSACCG